MSRKMQRREVSEAEVDAWVEEAEAGYDVEQLRSRIIGRPARAEAVALHRCKATARIPTNGVESAKELPA